MSNATMRMSTLQTESNEFKKQMVFQNIEVTPAFAQEILAINTSNRPRRKALVDRYTKDMINGCWLFTGEPISINTQSEVSNGQHRLESIIKSGTTQVMNIQTGIDPLAFSVIDTGSARTAGDTLAMQGYTNYTTVSGIVRYVSAYYNGTLPQYITLSRIKMTNQQMGIEAGKLDQIRLQESAKSANKYYARCKFMDITVFGPLLYILNTYDAESAHNFFDMLSTGENIGTNNHSSIYLLRNRLINAMSSGNKLSSKHRWAITIKAWNLYKQGKSTKWLKWTETSEPFPTILTN